MQSSTSAPKKLAILRRISNAILVILVLLITFNLWLMHSQNAQSWYNFESEQLGRSLAAQGARMLALPVANDDKEAIAAYVSKINADDFITGSALYDAQGKSIMSSSDQDYSMLSLFRVSQEQPLVFIEDIVLDDNVVGYVKLVLDREMVIKHHQEFNQNQLLQTLMIMFLTAIFAALLTRLYYKIKANYHALQDPNNA